MEKQLVKEILGNIFTSRLIDDAEIVLRKRNLAYFQISGAGHEGVQSALAKLLRPGIDWVIPYYRDRALCLGLGVSAYEMFAQSRGSIDDPSSHGRQMPAHFGSSKLNILNRSSCTGTQFNHAVGVAEAGEYLFKYNLGRAFEDEIIVVSSGEGTTSQGEFWEAFTQASVKNVRVLFVIEDNGFAISTPSSIQMPESSISKTLNGVPNLKVAECNGNDPIESYFVLQKIIEQMKEEGGPALLHARVTRPYSHSLSDDHSAYRTKKELELEKLEDVFYSFPLRLINDGILTRSEVEEIKKDSQEVVDKAFEKCLEALPPDPDGVEEHLFSKESIDAEESKIGEGEVSMAQALNSVLKAEFSKNQLLRLFGQDVADFAYTLLDGREKELKGKGGVFKVTHGVQMSSLNLDQVYDASLSESSIIGRAIGQAARGIKPIVEIQFFDYIWTAFMQLKNELATIRWRSAGDFKAPVVVRVPIGGYLKGGSIYHSQSGESLFTHIPGLKVAVPSTAADAAGLLREAIYGDDPVLFLEHKHLYYQGYNRCSEVPENHRIPFGKAKIAREGSDLTVVTWGALVQKSIDAAEKIKENLGKEVEVIDLRTLAPFDIKFVVESVRKTNRVLVAHEENKTSGFAGEIFAQINENCFFDLDAPPLRVTSMDLPVAYSPVLEERILPQIDDVFDAMKNILLI